MTTNKLDHYLLSMSIISGYIHCYLITNNKSDIELAGNMMADIIEHNKIATPISYMLLCTGPLKSDTIEQVRNIICTYSGNYKEDHFYKLWNNIENYHTTIFSLGKNHPANNVLEAIH